MGNPFAEEELPTQTAVNDPPKNDEGFFLEEGTGKSAGKFYCGRIIRNLYGKDIYCGPTEGPQCESCQRFQQFQAPFFQGLICVCGEPFENGMSQGTMLSKCRRCGKSRPLRETEELIKLHSKGFKKFFTDTMEGRPLREAYPRWHPVSHPNGEYTASIEGKYGDKSLRHFTKRLIEPTLKRPSSAPSLHAHALHQHTLALNEEAVDRITENYPSVHPRHCTQVPRPDVEEPEELNAPGMWTAGRFISWATATHGKRSYWPLDESPWQRE